MVVFIEQRTAYEIETWLEFRRVRFRAQSPGGFTVNARALEVWPSGLRTVTWAEPVAATSEAGMLAISRAALTNVVVRAAPFQSTVAPETKLPPSAVDRKSVV